MVAVIIVAAVVMATRRDSAPASSADAHVAPVVARPADTSRRAVVVADSSTATPPVAPPVAVPAATAPIVAAPAAIPVAADSLATGDVPVLTREIAMPLAGVNPAALHSSFNELRGGGTRPHEALDIMAARGTPVLSATKGRVLKLFNSVAGGLMIYAADSSERFILLYGHLNGYAPELRDGSPLTRGQVIGYVGSTGNADPNAPHLHFGVSRSANLKLWYKGEPIDPLPVLQQATKR